MIEIIVNGVYYDGQDGGIFNVNKGKWKKHCIFFYDYSDEIGYIINSLSFDQLNKLRLSIYNHIHHLIKFTKFGECNSRGEVFTGYKITSSVIHFTDDEFAQIIPDKSIRKKYFDWDNIKEKYSLKSDFINYVRLNGKTKRL